MNLRSRRCEERRKEWLVDFVIMNVDNKKRDGTNKNKIINQPTKSNRGFAWHRRFQVDLMAVRSQMRVFGIRIIPAGRCIMRH